MRPHWKYLTVTLVIGWFLGAASGLLIKHYCDSMGIHGRHGRVRERLYKDLQVTPEQKTRLDAIFAEGHQKLDQVYSEMKAKVEDVHSSTRMQIRQVLTPEQQSTFDKFSAKMEARFQQNFDRLYHKPDNSKS